MLRRRWLCELWRDFLVASGRREIWERNRSILILAIPLNEWTMVSTICYLRCGRRTMTRIGNSIRGDKQKANQALTV